MREISQITDRLAVGRIPYQLDAGSAPNQSELLQWIDELGLNREWELIARES